MSPKRKRGSSAAPPRAGSRAKRIILAATVEGLETQPSAWVEQKATGIVYGCKSYAPTIEAAAEAALRVFQRLDAQVRATQSNGFSWKKKEAPKS